MSKTGMCLETTAKSNLFYFIDNIFFRELWFMIPGDIGGLLYIIDFIVNYF